MTLGTTLSATSIFVPARRLRPRRARFAGLAVKYGGAGYPLTLGVLFVVGMQVADGANGWWMSHLTCRTDEAAAITSRTMTLAVAFGA